MTHIFVVLVINGGLTIQDQQFIQVMMKMIERVVHVSIVVHGVFSLRIKNGVVVKRMYIAIYVVVEFISFKN